MSTSKSIRGAVRSAFAAGILAAGLSLAGAGTAGAETIKPYKDALFAYPAILSQSDDGRLLVVDYQEKRDIDRRDEEPERRVKGRYVSLSVRRQQAMETLDAAGRMVDILRVGDMETARFAVVFIHGRGGDRRLGANDFSFGGNFNRLKNLAVGNGGLYVAPSIRSFDKDGLADLSAVIDVIAGQPGRPRIVLACASMGSFLCWSAARDAGLSGKLSGLVVMGGVADPDFATTPAGRAGLPLFLSHGSRDSVYPAEDQLAAYRRLADSGHPVRMVMFETGTHGTPVRMTDWRDTLNWILDR